MLGIATHAHVYALFFSSMAPKPKEEAIRAKLEKERVRKKVLDLAQSGELSLQAMADYPEVQMSKATVQFIIRALMGRESVQEKPSPV